MGRRREGCQIIGSAFGPVCTEAEAVWGWGRRTTWGFRQSLCRKGSQGNNQQFSEQFYLVLQLHFELAPANLILVKLLEQQCPITPLYGFCRSAMFSRFRDIHSFLSA
jgi:hypothetical protein